MENEQVMVFPVSLLADREAFWGVSCSRLKERIERIMAASFFMDKAAAELDQKFKQIIPYHVVVRAGKILQYARTKKGGESRLHSMRSVGFGGHINTEDAEGKAGYEAYVAGSLRELFVEELRIASPTIRNHAVGLLNDDRLDVGKVHLGVIHVVEIDDIGGVSSLDPSIDLLGFESPETVFRGNQQMAVPLEGWSELVMDRIISNGGPLRAFAAPDDQIVIPILNAQH